MQFCLLKKLPGYQNVMMCEECFKAAPEKLLETIEEANEESLNDSEREDVLNKIDKAIESSEPLPIEEVTHNPYFTRNVVSSISQNGQQEATLDVLDSYGPSPAQYFSLLMETSFYDIPGRAPRWATHSGDYHGRLYKTSS